MSQVMVNVTPTEFYYALNFNRRRRPLIGDTCNTAEECMLLMARALHKKEVDESVSYAERLSRFFSSDCTFRCAVDGTDKRGGYMILDGELIALHHVDTGRGDWMLSDALNHGARRLECFDLDHLVRLYERNGFRVTDRTANWVTGQPDVLEMEYLK